MGIVVGIFDLFTYAIPGSLYLAIVAYVCYRAHWIDLSTLTTTPSVLALAAITVSSFLVGHATYSIGNFIDRISPFYSHGQFASALERFLNRPGVRRDRPFLSVEPFLLQAAVEIKNQEAAVEISRLRAVGLMLRGSVFPLVLGAATAFVEIFTSHLQLFAGATGCLLLALAFGCLRRGARLRGWAVSKTYELCYWLDGLDEQTGNNDDCE